MTFPTPNRAALVKYYGQPWKLASDEKLVLERSWETSNITRVKVPFDLFMGGDRISNICVHKRLSESVGEILNEISKEFTEKERSFFGIDQYGGGFNFRPMRGTSEYKPENLSLHSYGAALDFSPQLNPLGKKYNSAEKMMPSEIIDIFTKHEWRWGGSFKTRPDCMHFEATSFPY